MRHTYCKVPVIFSLIRWGCVALWSSWWLSWSNGIYVVSTLEKCLEADEFYGNSLSGKLGIKSQVQPTFAVTSAQWCYLLRHLLPHPSDSKRLYVTVGRAWAVGSHAPGPEFRVHHLLSILNPKKGLTLSPNFIVCKIQIRISFSWGYWEK